MKSASTTLLFLVMTIPVLSQKRERSYYKNCSAVLSIVSTEWKADSIGKKGDRFDFFDDLRYSRIDKVGKELLLEKLGKPNQISRFYSGVTNKRYVGYIYYIAPINNYPARKPYEGLYIQFIFDENEISLVEITDGDFCG